MDKGEEKARSTGGQMKKRIKVVWLCHLSNERIREHLYLRVPILERIVRIITHNPSKENTDFAVWNTNGIREFEKFTDEIDLFIIAPFHYLVSREARFDMNGIHYYFYQDRPSFLLREFGKRLFKYHSKYYSNRKKAIEEVRRIQPDVIHLIGAENPNYGLAALDIPTGIPLIVQLQTLLSDSRFKENYFMSGGDYDYRCCVEKQLFMRADYIGTTVKFFLPIIAQINPKATILPIRIALGESITKKSDKTTFDFVYFASSIDKAADLAVEAFGLAFCKHPNITLDIIGSGSTGFVENLQRRIGELGLNKAVTFEGRLATHDDVISQIRKARFALLPLKVDMVSGTIREAMANGLPVATTITPSTPRLNACRESVLLSETGDHSALADNMCRLLEDEEFARRLSANALITASERLSNTDSMIEWKDAYFSILKHGTQC